MTKKQLEEELDRVMDLVHKALGAMEPNHKQSVTGLGREYLMKIIQPPEED